MKYLRAIIFMVLFVVAIPARAEDLITITSPEAGTVVYRGDTLVVKFEADPSVTNFILTTGIHQKGGILGPPSSDNTFSVKIPENAQIKLYEMHVLGFREKELISSHALPIRIEAPLDIASVRAELHSLQFNSIGEELSLLIRGTFSDGSTSYVNNSSKITFTSKNPDIATVDKAGEVKSVTSGNTEIIVTGATNGPLSIPVTVK